MVKRALVTTAAVVAGVIALQASSPKFFQSATQAEFLRGDLDNLTVDSRGQLTLGPAIELVHETSAPFLWALVPGPDNSLLLGTGNEGHVVRVDAEGKATSLFDAAELEAHALATASDGTLYVGSSPDGKIYKVDRQGRGTIFFEPEEKYIWALVVDPKGNLFAATGDRGTIYKISPDGEGERFYQARATHATALAFDRAGNLIVGTESPGRVLRVSADGRGFVLLDSPFQEIRSLRFDDKGTLYVAAVSGSGTSGPARAPDPGSERAPGEPSPAPVPTVSAEITSIAVVDVATSGSGGAGSMREDRRSPRGAVYRIMPDGLWDALWESRDDAPYDLIFDADGRLLVGTGNEGKIFRLEGDPLQPTLLTRAAAQQVMAFHKDSRGRLYFATANPGKLFSLSPERASRGTYESPPQDAGIVSTWGAVRWRGSAPAGSEIEVFTRSGNTATPDETWSPWSQAYRSAGGSPIASPNARYLQWRVVLSGRDASPVLTSVAAAYLQRNLRPQVRSVTVHPPGIVFQKPFTTGDPDLAGFENQSTPDRKLTNAAMTAQQGSSSSPALGRRTYQKGLQTLVWRADDENEDELSYDVFYRREGETIWRPLRRAMTDPILVWDTTTVPNGTYFVKIVASDSPSNATAVALAGELDSEALEIDNTASTIVIGDVQSQASRAIVTFEVRDDHSPIQRVECSQDGQTWRSVFPADGIADSRVERYEVAVEGGLGARGLTIRATDMMNNVATAQVNR
jgi:sugar lactone lactonase YvrE